MLFSYLRFWVALLTRLIICKNSYFKLINKEKQKNMLRKALFSQHIHKLFKLLFLLLVSHIYKFLVEELRKSLLCFRPHLCFSCPET